MDGNIKKLRELKKLSINELANEIKRKSVDFLDSPEWKQLRKEAISKYGMTCMKCRLKISHSRYCNVDHVKPRKSFPQLSLDINNLQILCGRCNKWKGNKIGEEYDYRPKSLVDLLLENSV